MDVKKTNARGIKTRQRILEYIVEYIEYHGYAPTYREIQDNCGLLSTSSVHGHLQRMFDDGSLETDEPDGSPRAIRVPGYHFVKKKPRKPRERFFDDIDDDDW